MFNSLSERLHKTIRNLSGQGRISEANVRETASEIRNALLEADVALPVIESFLTAVQERALGHDVLIGTTPGQTFIKIINDELVVLLGSENQALSFQAVPPVVILMAGLQGSGKTTSVGKLGRFIKNNEKKSVLVTSVDIYRPAAIEQLKTLANDLSLDYFPSDITQKPIDIANAALEHARKNFIDVVIIDTAGRLHIDDDMMREIKNIHAAVKPHETLFVVDSMTGQDAANTAKAFNDALPLTGIILTKTDGDARGGAALSIRQITQKPIKFIGTGEKSDAFEVFHPDRIASRILGMGDIVSLVEDVQKNVDAKEAEKTAKKVMKGQFDLEDYRTQLEQMNNMGGLSGLMSKLPGLPNMNAAMKNAKTEALQKSTKRHVALINSMTRKERRFPAIIKGSRRRRICAGAGLDVQDLNRLLKQFEQMQKVFKQMSKPGGMARMMQQMKGMMGQGGGSPFGM